MPLIISNEIWCKNVCSFIRWKCQLNTMTESDCIVLARLREEIQRCNRRGRWSRCWRWWRPPSASTPCWRSSATLGRRWPSTVSAGDRPTRRRWSRTCSWPVRSTDAAWFKESAPWPLQTRSRRPRKRLKRGRNKEIQWEKRFSTKENLILTCPYSIRTIQTNETWYNSTEDIFRLRVIFGVMDFKLDKKRNPILIFIGF